MDEKSLIGDIKFGSPFLDYFISRYYFCLLIYNKKDNVLDKTYGNRSEYLSGLSTSHLTLEIQLTYTDKDDVVEFCSFRFHLKIKL